MTEICLYNRNLIHTDYNSIDNIFKNTNDNYIKFYNKYISNEYEFNIKYWYDMKNKKFIDKIQNYNNKIFYSKNIQVNLFDSTYRTTDHTKISLSKYNINSHQSCCTMKQQGICSCNFQKQTYNFNFHFILDDYLNIYIPETNTLIIYNYFKFPLYSLFLLNSHIKLNDTYSFNSTNKEDDELYIHMQSYAYFIHLTITNRHETVDIFTDISKFIKYNKYIEIITPLLNLSKYITYSVYDKKEKFNQTIGNITRLLRYFNNNIKSSESLLQNMIYKRNILYKLSNELLSDNIILLENENKKIVEQIKILQTTIEHKQKRYKCNFESYTYHFMIGSFICLGCIITALDIK